QQDDDQAEEPGLALDPVPVGQNHLGGSCHGHTSDARPSRSRASHRGLPDGVNDTRRPPVPLAGEAAGARGGSAGTARRRGSGRVDVPSRTRAHVGDGDRLGGTRDGAALRGLAGGGRASGLLRGGHPCAAPGRPLWEVAYIPSLSVISLGLASLTIGLVRPWGEVFPAWLPWIGGRRVPLASP